MGGCRDGTAMDPSLLPRNPVFLAPHLHWFGVIQSFIMGVGGWGDIRIEIFFWGGRRPYVFASLSSVPPKLVGRRGTVIGEVYGFLDKLVFVFRGDGGGTPTPLLPYRPPPLSVCSVSLNLQNHLAASILKRGQRKIWIDPNKISLANFRRNVVCIHRDSLFIKKPIVVHSRARILMKNKAKRKGRHTRKALAWLGLSWLRL